MPDKPTCELGRRLCEPRILYKPGGRALCHGLECPDKPGDRISAQDYAKGRTWPPRGRIGER